MTNQTLERLKLSYKRGKEKRNLEIEIDAMNFLGVVVGHYILKNHDKEERRISCDNAHQIFNREIEDIKKLTYQTQNINTSKNLLENVFFKIGYYL